MAGYEDALADQVEGNERAACHLVVRGQLTRSFACDRLKVRRHHFRNKVIE